MEGSSHIKQCHIVINFFICGSCQNSKDTFSSVLSVEFVQICVCCCSVAAINCFKFCFLQTKQYFDEEKSQHDQYGRTDDSRPFRQHKA